jgi:hypothetical protein
VENFTSSQACLGAGLFALFQAKRLFFIAFFPVCLLTIYRWTSLCAKPEE